MQTTAVHVGAEGLVSWAHDDSGSVAMSNMLLSISGTAVGFKAGEFGKAQADKIFNSYRTSMMAMPRGFLEIEGPYSRSILPSAIGSGIGSVVGEKIGSYGSDVELFIDQFKSQRVEN